MKKPKNILLIEDDKDDQEFFIEALSNIETLTHCKIVNNGKEALHSLEVSESLPDVIFMDIQMPEMNGIDCLHEIMKKPSTKHIPVVMLSSSTERIDLAQQMGARTFLKKDGIRQTFRAQIERLINTDFTTEMLGTNNPVQHPFTV